MRFSQRAGITAVRVEIQLQSIDQSLRNKLWSGLTLAFFDLDPMSLPDLGHDMALRLWIHHFEQPADTIPRGALEGLQPHARRIAMEGEWYEVFDLVEACIGELKDPRRKNLSDLLNAFLIAEVSAYRVVDGRITEITNEAEIHSIEQAIQDSSGLVGVHTHLREALAKLTSRTQPDPRNSIKESISAVEAVCQSLTQDASATLGSALTRLEGAGISLHTALRESWLKMYGYTSDANGIRHALVDAPTVSPADAKYMLVSCSAFVSYLLELAAMSGIAVAPPKS